MVELKSWAPAWASRVTLEHSARTAVAAVVSLLVARLLRMPEAYWASITTLVVMQSTWGAALTASGQRFAGTLLGAAVGALVGTCAGANVVAFTAAIFGMGLMCWALRLDRNAYRFAGITLAIVTLVPRTRPAWMMATHRLIEVSVGIGVGLLLTLVWPDRLAAGAGQA
ncbi:MAG TPA: FUSC family protein [Terriglobia bacterium]|nr:FUSC family protein [Terriglobia bacterium]